MNCVGAGGVWGDQGDAREAGRDNLPAYQQGNAELPSLDISRIQKYIFNSIIVILEKCINILVKIKQK